MIDAKRLLVIAPHADDEILGCGGTMALAAERGAEVHALIVFDGAAGDPEDRFDREVYVDRRRREALAGGEHIGVNSYTFWNLPEGHLALDHELEQGAWRLQQLITSVRPDLILTPWDGDEHPDHRTVASAVRRVIERRARCSEPCYEDDLNIAVWGFEVWSPLEAEHLVDVSAVWESKIHALNEHVTQLAYSDLVERMTQLATRHGGGFMESFTELKASA